MALYTMTLKEMLEKTPLFDFQYTLNCDYIEKNTLENLIISRYLYNEIGSETVERFKQIFIVDYLTKLNTFIERVNQYEKIIKATEQDKRTYGVKTTRNNNQSELMPPMSVNLRNSNYATGKRTQDDVVNSEGWETMTPLSLHIMIKNEIKPYLYDFIESLRDNFMEVF